MKEKIYSTLKHSSIYGLGNVALKGMGIITLPIFAKVLTLAEFGAFGILDVTIGILAEILTLGQSNSVILFNNSTDYKEKKKSVFFTITISLLLFNSVFIIITELLGASFLRSIKVSSEFISFLPFIIYISCARMLNNIFMNKLRADGKSLFYTVITIIKILVFLALVFFMVLHLKLAITGILYSYLISEIVILMVQLPFMVTEMSVKFDRDILKQALKFGFPLLFSTIGIMILNLSDKYMIKFFINFESVGLYDFAYRIAGVIYMFLILPFNQAFLPAAYKVYNQPGDKRYYTKAMTYMCFITVWGGLALSLFSSWIILVMGNKNYLEAELFIPLIIVAYIFSGKRNIASTGLLLAGKTSYIAYITMGAAIINIALNIWLIPIYGVIAAAYTTLFSFVLFYFITKFLADKFYPIPYEGMKILQLFVLGIALYIIASLLPFENIIVTFVLKLILVISFPFILVPLNFYEKIELDILTKTLKNPFAIKKIILNILRHED